MNRQRRGARLDGVASGELRSAPGPRVRTRRLPAPTLLEPPTRVRTFLRAPQGKSEVTGELGAGGVRCSVPGPAYIRRETQSVPAA